MHTLASRHQRAFLLLTPMLVELENLTVHYGQKVVLDSLNLQLEGGAIGLLGPNGAGKSTLLKTLLGFLKPTAGIARLFGQDVTHQGTDVRRQIGYMPENDSYIPGMSAVSFIGYAGQLCGMTNRAAKQRAHEVLNYVGIGEIRYRPIETYATGLRQRLKLAQALVHDPALLLLDEPTSGMDQKGRESMLSLVADLAANREIHVIFSSHILNDIESTCTIVIALNDGKIAFSGNLQVFQSTQKVTYDLGLKGDVNRYITALNQYGCNCERMSELRILATPDDQTTATSANEMNGGVFFQVALETNTQIRHLRLVKPSLEDVFYQRLADTNSPQD